jgi:hypothetical protein
VVRELITHLSAQRLAARLTIIAQLQHPLKPDCLQVSLVRRAGGERISIRT